MPLVAVGSKNPAKTKGVERAFARLSRGFHFIAVESPTRPQPMGLTEILEGATARAEAALRSGADFGVGVEAGLFPVEPGRTINLQVAVVIDVGGRKGVGLSSGFEVPEDFVKRIKREGLELDRYAHEITGAEKIAEEEGIVHHLTRGAISRVDMTEECVSMALIPWLSAK